MTCLYGAGRSGNDSRSLQLSVDFWDPPRNKLLISHNYTRDSECCVNKIFSTCFFGSSDIESWLSPEQSLSYILQSESLAKL